jgi:phosphotransferase system HPr (HPr) family protein
MSADTLSKAFTINNEFGLHARPAALLVKCASQFDCTIQIEKDGMCVSGNSIMGLLTLEGHQGSVLNIEAKGPQAEEALAALGELFDRNFDE